MGETKNMYGILVWIPLRKQQLGELGRREEVTIKMDLD
jgi:hypothetical protein